ncbi:MAG: hypothetical protein ACR2G4_12510 [Pyrinomonadaceae bacterium]
MFCPQCGADKQRTDAYCTRCGEWLADVNALRRHGRRLPHSARTPEQRLRVMLVFNALDALLALAAAILLFGTFINRTGTPATVFLAASFCIVIAVHQIVSLVFNVKMQLRLKRARASAATTAVESLAGESQWDAPAALPLAEAQFSLKDVRGSVAENTTELLESIPLRPEPRQTR